MARTTSVQKILLVVGSLAAAAVLAEVGLRAAGLVHAWGRGADPSLAHDEGGVYRILCLGESTTRGFGVKPYPMMLEESLEDRFGTPVAAVNAGYTSAHSLSLVERAPELLAAVDPHAVVVMMGVNDPFYFGASDSDADLVDLETQLLLLRSRLYKLLRLLWHNARERVGPVRASARAVADYDAAFRESHEAWTGGRLREPARRFRAFIDAARAAGEREADGSLAIPGGYRFQYLNAHVALARVHLDAGSPERARAVYEEAAALHPRDAFFERGLAGVWEEIGDPTRAAAHRARARERAAAHAPHATRVAFAKLREILEPTDVTVVLMQYPLRSADVLKRLWGSGSDAHFVDNESLFREAIARLGYDALFMDRFAGDFGHCTAEGNRLIAENLVARVFAPILSARAEGQAP